MKHCESILQDAERKAEKESIQKIEAFKKLEKHVYRRIEDERRLPKADRPNHDHLEGELDKSIRELNTDLLDIEIKL